jgi:hypothetical protein
MDKKVMEKLEDSFCEVLQSYADKGFQNPSQVETAKAALSGLVKIKMLEGMDKFEGNSFRAYHDEDMPQRGYHDDGYSGHDKMISQLEKMRETANPNDRRMIDEWVQRLNQR